MCPSSLLALDRPNQLEHSGKLLRDYLVGSRNPGSNIALVSVLLLLLILLLLLLSHCGVGRGAGVGRGLGVGSHLPVHGVGVAVGVGDAVGVGVGVGEGPDCAQYLPPLLKKMPIFSPPQTIISLPVQT